MRRKDKLETPYKNWQDDDDDEEEDFPDGPSSARSRLTPTSSNPRANPVLDFTDVLANSPEPITGKENGAERRGELCRRQGTVEADELLECFYIGSYDMSGLPVRGRGCINLPASIIWQNSQDLDRKPKRVGSWSGRQHHSSTVKKKGDCSGGIKPRYVRLATGSDKLHVLDQSSEQMLMDFSYRKIPFVGTHPKYTRLFAFIAEAPTCKTPFCHAFKCEDTASAKMAACMLSDLFQKKIQELVKESAKSEKSVRSPS